MIRRLALVCVLLLPCSAPGSDLGLSGARPAFRDMPEDGWDLRYTDQLAALAYQSASHTVRIETLRTLPEPFDPSYPAREDGVGVVVRPGLLVTTARYLDGADAVEIVLRDLTRVPARVAVLDVEEGLALVSFDPARCEGLVPVPSVVALSDTTEIAATVVIPTGLIGAAAGLRVAAAMKGEDGRLFLSGFGVNGLPAFDNKGQLVAIALRPTPARMRAIAVDGGKIAAWLPGALRRAQKKAGPAR